MVNANEKLPHTACCLTEGQSKGTGHSASTEEASHLEVPTVRAQCYVGFGVLFVY